MGTISFRALGPPVEMPIATASMINDPAARVGVRTGAATAGRDFIKDCSERRVAKAWHTRLRSDYKKPLDWH